MNPWKGLKGLPHNMWVLFFATLINRSGTMVLPFLALYMTKEMGINPGEAGLALTIYGVGSLITSPFAGKLSDKIGSLRVMKYSLIISGILLLIYSFITSYFAVLLLTAVWAVVSEAFRPANMSLISEVVLPEQRRTAFALNRLAINLGMSIGPAAGGFLAMADFHLLFYADALTSVTAGVFLIFAKWDTKETEIIPTNLITEKNKNSIAKIFSDKKYIFFLIALIPVQIVFFQHIGAMPLFLVEELGYTEALFGTLAAVNTIIIILTEVPLTTYLTKFEEGKLLAVGSFLVAIGFGGMAVAKDIVPLVITVILWTIGEMIIFPVSANYAASAAPKEKRGIYMGFYQMTFSIAFALGPWLGTMVYDFYGSFILWTGTFFFSIITVLMMLKLKPVHSTAAQEKVFTETTEV